jgi:hypothetical protein
LERLRKKSLCNALTARMEGNVQHLCSLFMSEATMVPQQALVLEVLANAASEATLVDLQILARSAFRQMLEDQPDLIQTRETPIRVPLILFFHRLLSILPIQMVESDMVTVYLRSLTNLTEVDR